MIRLFTFLTLMCWAMTVFSQVKSGHSAAEISLPDSSGNIVRLSDLKGKVVLVDFWASWCGPCRNNNPHLTRLYNRYHPEGLQILGVSIDNDQESWRKAIMQDNLQWIQ